MFVLLKNKRNFWFFVREEKLLFYLNIVSSDTKFVVDCWWRETSIFMKNNLKLIPGYMVCVRSEPKFHFE